jgi:hypothetical protein
LWAGLIQTIVATPVELIKCKMQVRGERSWRATGRLLGLGHAGSWSLPSDPGPLCPCVPCVNGGACGYNTSAGVGRWSLVAGRWSLVAGRWSLAHLACSPLGRVAGACLCTDGGPWRAPHVRWAVGLPEEGLAAVQSFPAPCSSRLRPPTPCNPFCCPGTPRHPRYLWHPPPPEHLPPCARRLRESLAVAPPCVPLPLPPPSSSLFPQMVSANGLRLGLFRGFVITAWRDVPGYACYFLAYEYTKRTLASILGLPDSNMGVLLCAGAAAGLFGWGEFRSVLCGGGVCGGRGEGCAARLSPSRAPSRTTPLGYPAGTVRVNTLWGGPCGLWDRCHVPL